MWNQHVEGGATSICWSVVHGPVSLQLGNRARPATDSDDLFAIWTVTDPGRPTPACAFHGWLS
jgi:hypothetical protein